VYAIINSTFTDSFSHIGLIISYTSKLFFKNWGWVLVVEII